MVVQQDKNSSVAPHHARLQTPSSADGTVGTEHPVLVLQVGSDIDPGLKRGQSPNKDTLSVTHGVMPASSGTPNPFTLLMVAARRHASKQEPTC